MDASSDARASKRRPEEDEDAAFKDNIKWFDQANFVNRKMPHDQLCADVVTLGANTKTAVTEVAEVTETATTSLRYNNSNKVHTTIYND